MVTRVILGEQSCTVEDNRRVVLRGGDIRQARTGPVFADPLDVAATALVTCRTGELPVLTVGNTPATCPEVFIGSRTDRVVD